MEEVRLEEKKVEEEWIRIEEKVKEAIEKIKKGREKTGKRMREWWDMKCKEKKRVVKRRLREWRKGVGQEQEYKKEKKCWNVWSVHVVTIK